MLDEDNADEFLDPFWKLREIKGRRRKDCKNL